MRNSMVSRTYCHNLIVLALLATTAFVAGCTGSAAGKSSNNNSSGAQLTASASSVSFGQTAIGGNSAQTVTISATGSSVTIQSVAASGTGFSVVQPQLPAT